MSFENNIQNGSSMRGSSRMGSLFGVFLILIAVAAYNFYAKPLMSSTKASLLEVDEINNNLTVLKKEILDFETAKNDLGLATEVDRFEVLKKIPENLDQDEVIRNLIKIATENDIILNSISFGKGGTIDQAVSSLRVNASFQGGFQDLVTFLRGLETNERFFKVNSISVQLSNLTAFGVRTANFSLSIEAFYQN